MITGLGQDLARTVAFLRQEWDFEWRHAAICNNYDQLFLDPPALAQLRSELWSILGLYTQIPAPHPEHVGSSSRCRPTPTAPTIPPAQEANDPATG